MYLNTLVQWYFVLDFSSAINKLNSFTIHKHLRLLVFLTYRKLNEEKGRKRNIYLHTLSL